jgi:hypothetical protein
MPSILAKIVNLAAKRTETLTGKTWTDNDSNTRYAADVIAHFEDASGKMPGDVGYVGPSVVPVPLARKESLTEVEMETGKITFSQPMKGIEIYNESNSNSLTYTINGIGVILEPGASDKSYYDSFTEVTITGTDLDFTAVGLG